MKKSNWYLEFFKIKDPEKTREWYKNLGFDTNEYGTVQLQDEK